MKTVFSNLLTAVMGGIIALVVYSEIDNAGQHQQHSLIPNAYANTTRTVSVPMIDFTQIAAQSTPAVVHIKTKVIGKSNGNSPFQDLFGNDFYGNAPKKYDYASGSGVIIDDRGYIVTNQHVIEDADEIEVVLHDKRSVKARLIGTDSSTDLAVIKIKANNLSIVPYGNSDKVKVGEWVMAVGNPFNLASTVTTGIVSAKARNINIMRDNLAIESFIQTDAAVNSGNSGGALVNLQGQLVGINTAIATPTGYFAGYSFAVPVNIVKKVVSDLIEYGSVQRGFLGVSIRDVDANLADKLGLVAVKGVYVSDVGIGSAAEEAGIYEGDIITKVAGIEVNSSPELQEVVSRYSPNDKIAIILQRAGQTKDVNVKLKSKYER